MAEEMRAVGFEEHGDLEQLQLLTVPVPEPGPGEVLIDVEATALNHQDLIAVRELEHYVPEYPFWGGGDMAGEIADVGADVEGWSVGDRVVVYPALPCGECELCIQGEHSMCENYRVYGEHAKGGFAEYAAVPAANLMRVPDEVDTVTAAAAPMAAGTAWRALLSRADLGPHEDALIVGATGGVGTFAVQIAKEVINCRRLYATTSTERKAEFLRDLGVDHVIDYTEEDFAARVWELTGKRGVDVVYNNVGGDTWVPSMRSLHNGGRLVASGATAGPNPETEIRLLFVRQFDVMGSTTFNRKEFGEIMEQVFDGPVDPVVDETFPLAEFEPAFERMDQRELLGKVVLTQT